MEIGIKDYANTYFEDKSGKVKSMLEASLLKEHIIPSCSIGGGLNPNWKVTFNEGLFSLKYDKEGNIIYYSNHVSPATEWDVLYLLRQTLDRQLNDKGFMTLHASAIKKKDKAILIEGASGSGKTSLVLSGKEKGYSFLGNESIVVSPTLEVIAGTKIIVYKEDMAKRFFSHLINAHSPSPGTLVLKPEELYGKNVIDNPELIGLIVSPKVSSESAFYPASKKIVKHSLYRSSSRYVSGLFLIDDMSKSCPINLDNSVCRENRANLVNKLVENTSCYRIEGKPSNILDKINSLS